MGKKRIFFIIFFGKLKIISQLNFDTCHKNVIQTNFRKKIIKYSMKFLFWTLRNVGKLIVNLIHKRYIKNHFPSISLLHINKIFNVLFFGKKM